MNMKRKITPTHTLDWYVKWLARPCCLVAWCFAHPSICQGSIYCLH